MARGSISAGTHIGYNNSTGVISVSSATVATANTLVERDSTASITAYKVYGTLIGNVQTFSLDAIGVVLTVPEIIGNIFTCAAADNSTIQLPDSSSIVAGYRILIRNRSSHIITISDSSNTIVTIPATEHKEIACDGFAWFVV